MPPAKVVVSDPPPAPLSSALRNELIGALFSQTEAIPELQKTLLAECETSGWLSAVRERSIQLFKEDESRSHSDIVKILEKEARKHGAGRDTYKGAQSVGKGTNQEPIAVDVRMPDKAVREGTAIIRGAFDGIVEIEGTSQSDNT